MGMQMLLDKTLFNEIRVAFTKYVFKNVDESYVLVCSAFHNCNVVDRISQGDNVYIFTTKLIETLDKFGICEDDKEHALITLLRTFSEYTNNVDWYDLIRRVELDYIEKKVIQPNKTTRIIPPVKYTCIKRLTHFTKKHISVAIYSIFALMLGGIGILSMLFVMQNRLDTIPSSPSPSTPVTIVDVNATPQDNVCRHTVNEGQSLNEIAYVYQQSIEDVLQANPSITDRRRISVTDQIIIPNCQSITGMPKLLFVPTSNVFTREMGNTESDIVSRITENTPLEILGYIGNGFDAWYLVKLPNNISSTVFKCAWIYSQVNGYVITEYNQSILFYQSLSRVPALIGADLITCEIRRPR
jgi:hypothetical protein